MEYKIVLPYGIFLPYCIDCGMEVSSRQVRRIEALIDRYDGRCEICIDGTVIVTKSHRPQRV